MSSMWDHYQVLLTRVAGLAARSGLIGDPLQAACVPLWRDAPTSLHEHWERRHPQKRSHPDCQLTEASLRNYRLNRKNIQQNLFFPPQTPKKKKKGLFFFLELRSFAVFPKYRIELSFPPENDDGWSDVKGSGARKQSHHGRGACGGI